MKNKTINNNFLDGIIYSSSFYRKIIFATVIGLLMLNASSAHVKWFVDPSTSASAAFQPYSLTDTSVLVWIGFAVVLIGLSIFLDSRIPDLPIAKGSLRHDVVEIFRVFTGMSLLLTAYDGNLIAPHMPAYGWFGCSLLFIQLIVGILFIANRFIWQASLLIFILVLGVLIQYGIVSVIEYINIIGIALFFLFNHLADERARKKYKLYSVDLLRIFTGISLLTLGITEKLSGAVLGQEFIAQYAWNFMPMLGFESFSDRLFVLSAGVMEVVFGMILILGTTTRLNTLAVSIFMLASNITFLIVNDNDAALTELIGHMPFIGSALVLLLFGYGQKLKITHLFAKGSPTKPV